MYVPKGPRGANINVNKINKLNIPELIKNNGIVFIKSKFKTIKHYDVNSLYPSAMLHYKYPTDILGKFIGDIRLINNYSHYFEENLGIYKLNVTSPKNILHPILPIKSKNNTIYPTGKWTGWYYIEEIKNAIKYGYKFEILGGYIFSSDFIFTDYINNLYSIKENSNKDDPMYLIAKLLFKSLFGKMALSPHIYKYKFFTLKNFNNEIIKDKIKDSIKEYIKVGNHYLVGFENPSDHVLSNIAVGLAITSYSRIIMSQIKNNPNINLYYKLYLINSLTFCII
nr:hypothetical protein P2X57_mgp54 [Fuscoporia gilva]WDD39611.1 hypothetical protein [Fuscoporia gilva]